MVTSFTLVRHGETDWNASGRWQGQAHVPLNELGRHQARLLAAHLTLCHSTFDGIVSSDSLRARETGQILAEALGMPLELDARLREIDLGEWQGLTSEEVRTWDADRYLQVEHDPWLVPRPGGESGADVGARALACLEARVPFVPDLGDEPGRFAEPRAKQLVISHGGTIRNLLQHLGLTRADRVVVGNTASSALVRGQGPDARPVWHLAAFNDLTHLGNQSARVEVEP